MKYLLLISAIMLAACAKPNTDSNLVNKYLAAANIDLPRVTGPYTIDMVVRRDNVLETVATIKPAEMTNAQYKEWLKGESISDAQDDEIKAICDNPYFDDLVAQGFTFRFQNLEIDKIACWNH